jgi:GNAT superfamily N-acetyltransferase
VDRDQVLREAESWVWVPVDAEDETRPDHRLTLYPTFASVQWSRTDGPFDELLDDVLRRAEASGKPLVRWWTRATSRPVDTAARLAAHGFRPAETLDVLALDLFRGDADTMVDRLALPDDVEVRRVADEDGVRLAGDLAARVFDESPPTAAQVAEQVAELDEERRTGRWTTGRWVAVLDGRPVGSAGATLAGRMCRLWGGAVLADARGRGAYRALLAARCAAALEAGATTVLVKGRVDTSAPLLRRAGFEVLGQEQCHERALAGRPSAAAAGREA